MENRKIKIVSVYLYKAARALRTVGNPLIHTFLGVAAFLLAAMMLLVAAAVIMRYVFNRPILGDMELIRFMLVTLLSFSMAYCASAKSHVRVTALVSRFSGRFQAMAKALMDFFSLGFVLMIVWYSLVQAKLLWQRGYATIIFKIPMFPFALVLSFGFAVFALVILADLAESLAEAMER
jgi:TRAP-type C4-dicarboxylate transport system permease small subunit